MHDTHGRPEQGPVPRGPPQTPAPPGRVGRSSGRQAGSAGEPARRGGPRWAGRGAPPYGGGQGRPGMSSGAMGREGGGALHQPGKTPYDRGDVLPGLRKKCAKKMHKKYAKIAKKCVLPPPPCAYCQTSKVVHCDRHKNHLDSVISAPFCRPQGVYRGGWIGFGWSGGRLQLEF